MIHLLALIIAIAAVPVDLSEAFAELGTKTVRVLYDNNNVRWETSHVRGQKHGPVRGFYPNGKPMWQCTYSNGKRNGIFSAWYPDGAILSTMTFKDDVLHGESRMYLDDGVLFNNEFHIMGEKVSEEVWKKQQPPDAKEVRQPGG